MVCLLFRIIFAPEIQQRCSPAQLQVGCRTNFVNLLVNSVIEVELCTFSSNVASASRRRALE